MQLYSICYAKPWALRVGMQLYLLCPAKGTQRQHIQKYLLCPAKGTQCQHTEVFVMPSKGHSASAYRSICYAQPRALSVSIQKYLLCPAKGTQRQHTEVFVMPRQGHSASAYRSICYAECTRFAYSLLLTSGSLQERFSVLKSIPSTFPWVLLQKALS